MAGGKLTANTVKHASGPARLCDGSGLYLQITKTGTKSWLFRVKMAGADTWHGLGTAGDRDVTLLQARELAAECRKLVRAGINPVEHKREAREARKAERPRKTFRECADMYIASHEAGWKSAKHAGQWKATLATYAYPTIGDLPAGAITTGHVLDILQPIWTTKTETATRLRGRIEAILDWAKVAEYRTGDNPARWRGHLRHMLPERNKVRRVEHHASLPYAEVGAFMAMLRAQPGLAAKALDFLILTATRTSETLNMQWAEVDLDRAVWIVPAERMKGGREHRVPLSPAAVDILRHMLNVRQNEYVFPGARKGRPLSNMAMLVLLRRMGRGDLTAHGFRSTFRVWAEEQTSFPVAVTELALAHVQPDKVLAAYQRSDLFERRRRLMEQWATYCGTAERSGEVVQIRTA